MTSHRYRDEILGRIFVSYASAIKEDFMFMDKFKNKITRKNGNGQIYEEGIRRMECPACSQDMKRIENVCKMLGG